MTNDIQDLMEAIRRRVADENGRLLQPKDSIMVAITGFYVLLEQIVDELAQAQSGHLTRFVEQVDAALGRSNADAESRSRAIFATIRESSADGARIAIEQVTDAATVQLRLAMSKHESALRRTSWICSASALLAVGGAMFICSFLALR